MDMIHWEAVNMFFVRHIKDNKDLMEFFEKSSTWIWEMHLLQPTWTSNEFSAWFIINNSWRREMAKE